MSLMLHTQLLLGCLSFAHVNPTITLSLIGSQYKIIAKILANQLSRVASSVVGDDDLDDDLCDDDDPASVHVVSSDDSSKDEN
ncbi:RNA-directed DNA polymerase, eukaryota, reverse transcriptase zinc-binding domain protein [Tanacetum coccineum]